MDAPKMMNDPLANGKGYRIIQIHPTLKCNLTCLHCYSGSAPQLKKELDVHALQSFLAEAYEEGFNAVSISGGEPFLYSGLEPLLHYAKSLGYLTSVTTNGMLFKPGGRNVGILQYIDLLAISLDGEPEHHNFMRNSPKAFERMLAGLELVKDAMDHYGFIHTVTPHTLPSLLWIADFVAHHRGRLLQMHPLESLGRGKDVYESLALNQALLQKIYILNHYLEQKYHGQFVTELDLLHRDHLLEHPQNVYARVEDCGGERIADHLREMIIDENGNIVPVSHGFSRHYQIGNIHEGSTFRSMSQRFVREQLPSLRSLFDETFEEIVANEDVELLNWAELIVLNSQRKYWEAVGV